MNLHEAWLRIKSALQRPGQARALSAKEKQAIKVLDNFLDPYIKRICTMKGD